MVATHVNHHPLGNRRVCSFYESGAPLLALAIYSSADRRARLARDCKHESIVDGFVDVVAFPGFLEIRRNKVPWKVRYSLVTERSGIRLFLLRLAQ